MKGSISSPTCILSLVILTYTVLIGVIPTVGHGLILIPFSLSTIFLSLVMPDGLFICFSDRLRYVFLCAATVLFCLISMIYISHISAVHIIFPVESIKSVSGKVIFDSSFSGSGNHVMTIYIQSTENIFGQNGSACGLITAVGKEKAIITSGIRVKLFGRFTDDNMFVYDSIQVLNRSRINDFREYIIPRLEERTGNELSTMLILGRSDTLHSPIKDLASSCGCMHVLALSGMHLHAVTSPAELIKNKYIKFIFKTALSAVFLFIAGPRASLVRSAIFIMLSFLPVYERLTVTLMIQVLVFPLSLFNIGSVYGYISVFALLLLAPMVSPFLSFIMGKPLGNTVGSSLAVLCANAPLQIMISGTWKPAAIVAGPIASLLATFSMSLGFAEIISDNWGPLVFLNNCVYEAMVKMLTFFSGFRDGGLVEYAVLFSVFLSLILISSVFHRHLKCTIVQNAKIK